MPKKFDAKRYWANKPLCSVCKNHKVKEGTICSECRNAEIKKKRAEMKAAKKTFEILSNMKQAKEEKYIQANEQENDSIANSVVVKKHKPISKELQNKIVRLFTYLEKALSLDDTIIRDFRLTATAPSPWWLGDLPRDAENLYIRPFDTAEVVDTLPQKTAWISVEKKNIKPAPRPPSELNEWVSEITPIEKPIAKDKIDREIRFENDLERVREFKEFRNDFQQGDKVPKLLTDWVILNPSKLPEAIEAIYVEDKFTDHPELRRLLEGYIENEWESWAEKVKKIYKANILYDQLYALRLLLKNEGDNYELLLGHGFLTWKHRGVGSIYAPVFLTALTLDFDASKRIIEVSPDPMFKGFAEISSLYETDNPAEMDLVTWSDKINASPFDFWHLETLKNQSKTLINYISPDSEDNFADEITSAPNITEHPSIWNAPVIFARKRNNDLWSKYAGIIRRDIEQNTIEPTEFITDLVGDYGEDQEEIEITGEKNVEETAIKESELFFPLFWNDEQKRIAERLDANYGVVVKGPPGTGKSHTIANLISRFLAQGKTVLVTSQTSKALEVLRDKLPENIRSLAVSQLNQTAKRDDVLQQSITEISSNLGERHTKFSEDKATNIRKELQRVREEKSTLANQIRKYVLTDSSIKINIDGQDIKPIDAAQLIAKQTSNKELEWFTDKIHFETELNFTEADLQEAYSFLAELTQEERELYKYELPELEVLPNEETALEAFASYRDLSTKAKTSDKLFNDSTASFKSEELSVILEKLLQANKVLNSINEDYEKEIFNLCIISQSEQEKWQTTLIKISEKIQLIGKSRNIILGHDIVGNVDLSLNDKVEAINILKDKTIGGKIGTFGKLLLSSNAKKVLQSYTVDGFTIDNAEHVEILRQKILAEKAGKEIKTLLEQSFGGLKSSPEVMSSTPFDVIQIEVLVASLRRIANYATDFAEIDEFCKKTKQLSDFSYTKKEHIEKVIEITASSVARFELSKLEELFVGWIKIVKDSVIADPHSIVQKLAVAIEKRNSTGYKNALSELLSLSDQKKKAIKLNMLNQKICQFTPNLYHDIIGLADQKQEFECPNNLGLAWKIARLQSWLNSIHNHTSIDELQNQLERLTKREYQLNSELVTVLAWQRQIDKVSKRQRDALMAWSHAMKKYGKGTGKYAVTHLRAAQEALKEAKNAVPVWIMPLHRAAQMFSEPKAGMFDVVIFDEASQCDIRGLTIGYLGKKLLVVGDPEQISPAGLFQDQEKIFELISRFLSDIPFKESFSITSSLFDLAKIRLSNIIQLNEHFRCVPEIIAFSNYHIYEGKLKPLRYPHPRGLLKPALVPIFVEKGYQNTNNKVNEPEANKIVEKLVDCLKDPNYQKRPDGRLCTFGIISLLAEDQAKYIEKLIRELVAKGVITEKEIEERRIECGDAYKFQGDERDVMLISMVRALNPNDLQDTIAPLTSEDAKRRFNVAASRARDQMFLFHSIPLTSFGNRNDWRYKLLNWFYDPKKEELKAGRESLKKEFDSGKASQFSVDVGNLLIDRGYQVLPEYPVIGYRIDLVVQGEDSRLAIECDGDQYHTFENWEEDQVREKQLRRAGWEFWRVTGSSFYRYKEKALDSLWKKLDEMNIKPII